MATGAIRDAQMDSESHRHRRALVEAAAVVLECLTVALMPQVSWQAIARSSPPPPAHPALCPFVMPLIPQSVAPDSHLSAQHLKNYRDWSGAKRRGLCFGRNATLWADSFVGARSLDCVFRDWPWSERQRMVFSSLLLRGQAVVSQRQGLTGRPGLRLRLRAGQESRIAAMSCGAWAPRYP